MRVACELVDRKTFELEKLIEHRKSRINSKSESR